MATASGHPEDDSNSVEDRITQVSQRLEVAAIGLQELVRQLREAIDDPRYSPDADSGPSPSDNGENEDEDDGAE